MKGIVKMIKKILSFTLALCMILSVACLSAYAVDPANGGDEPELVDGYYEIANADQLFWFAEEVNSGNWSINGKLTADIVINEGDVAGCNGTKKSGWKDWTPIKYYRGTFDGAGHTISGIYVNDISANATGLFMSTRSESSVKNVGVVNSYIHGDFYVGGVVGSASGNIDNCFNTGTIVGNNYVGGVAGSADENIEDCYNTGNICANEYSAGGIVGYTFSSVTNCYNNGVISAPGGAGGGIVGTADTQACSISVKGCYNTGKVTGEDWWIGGIVGNINEEEYDLTIENCYNSGDISGDNYVGGIAGILQWECSIDNCYNIGTINGNGNVAGVAGRATGDVSNCHNIGTINGNSDVGGVVGFSYGDKIDNCYNKGTVIGNNYVGGIVGYDVCDISNCYNSGNISGEDFVGGVIGKLQAGNVSDCYNLGSVSGIDTIGGVIGLIGIAYNSEATSIYNCYNAGVIKGKSDIGGVVGIIDAQDAGKISIVNCYNTAPITGVSLSNSFMDVSREVGGVIGMASIRSGSKLSVTNCYNTSEIKGIISVGGIGGWMAAYDDSEIVVENCYSSGAVSGSSNTVGGVFGYVESASITNCYYLSTSDSLARAAGILGIGDTTADVEGETTGATLEQFKSGEVAYSINKNAGKIIYYQTIGKDSAPTLDETRGKVIFEGGKYKNEKKESEEDTTAAQFFGSVELKGSELKAGQFKFELYDRNGKLVDTATNDADGMIGFSSVKLENAGNHTYTVKQKNLGASGIMYDSEVFTVTARASYDSNSELKVVVTIPKAIEFRNEYSTGTCSATLSAKVKLAGGELAGGELAGGEFSFNLRSGSGHIIKTVTNKADGSIDLSSVKFEKEGTFTYYVEQVKGKLADIEYDMDLEKITVTVTDDGKGNLTAKVSGSVTFENTYKD